MSDNDVVFRGYSFGHERPVVGEVVFNIATTGYPESLTDPSYTGQLMMLTYPPVGNYSAPPCTFEPNGTATFMENEKIHAKAIIVSDYSHEYSYQNAERSLDDRLKEEKIPGIYSTNTRALIKRLCEHSVVIGHIVIDDTDNEIGSGKLKIKDHEHVSYVDRVSYREIICYLPDGTSRTCSLSEAPNPRFSILNSQFLKRVMLLDCGMKHNVIRCPLRRNVAVVRIPWGYDFNQLEYDGLFISSSPNDPDTCDAVARNVCKAFSGDKPICGICAGSRLLTKTGGASIYELKYGHYNHSRSVCVVGTGRYFITLQNRGHAVDNDTLGEKWEPLSTNMNDGTNEGIRHKMEPFPSSQFCPGVCSGSLDIESMFDGFTKLL